MQKDRGKNGEIVADMKRKDKTETESYKERE
jgi:hypothetical protein